MKKMVNNFAILQDKLQVLFSVTTKSLLYENDVRTAFSIQH